MDLRLLGVGVVCWGALHGAVAVNADDDLSGNVSLDVTACAPATGPEVQRILQLELASLVSNHPDVAPEPLRIEVTCNGETIELTVADRARGHRHLHRTLPVHGALDTASFRSGLDRLIALAAAELVFSRWTSQTRTPRPPADADDHFEETLPEPLSMPSRRPASSAPASPQRDAGEDALASPKKEQRAPSREKEAASKTTAPDSTKPDRVRASHRDIPGLRGALRLSPSWQRHFSGGSHLFGAEAGGMLYGKQRFFLDVGLAAAAGLDKRNVGSIGLLSVTGIVAAGVFGTLFSASLEGRFSVGLRTGYGRLKGRSTSDAVAGETVSGPCSGVLGRLSAATTRRLAVGLTVELGYDFYGNVGHVVGASSVKLRGPRLAVLLDVLYHLRRFRR